MRLAEGGLRRTGEGSLRGLFPFTVRSWRLRGSEITSITLASKPKTSQERARQPKISHKHRCKNPQ